MLRSIDWYLATDVSGQSIGTGCPGTSVTVYKSTFGSGRPKLHIFSLFITIMKLSVA